MKASAHNQQPESGPQKMLKCPNLNSLPCALEFCLSQICQARVYLQGLCSVQGQTLGIKLQRLHWINPHVQIDSDRIWSTLCLIFTFPSRHQLIHRNGNSCDPRYSDPQRWWDRPVSHPSKLRGPGYQSSQTCEATASGSGQHSARWAGVATKGRRILWMFVQVLHSFQNHLKLWTADESSKNHFRFGEGRAG